MRKVILIILLIVFAGFGFFCIISSVAGLFFQPIDYMPDIFSAAEGERVNVSARYFTTCVYEVKHRIGIIPSVHEYYYAFMNERENKAYLVRLNKDFEESGEADIEEIGEKLNDIGFKHASALEVGVTGRVKGLNDTAELQEVISKFEQNGVTLYSEYYLDTIYQINYLWRFAVGAGLLLFSSEFSVFLRHKEGIAAPQKVYCIVVNVIGMASIIGAILLLQLG
ncbi:MAG: hypothetical protein NC203_01040 [Firmicutes bacterium]|nr:hypothetical protein [[Eubacterium] siraeum]MCM1486925.1 hypothetical protein [Bacillota bacterium]